VAVAGSVDEVAIDEVPDDFESRLAYRIAHGEAARLAEIATFDHGYGRGFAGCVGDQAEAIEREVMRRMGPDQFLPGISGFA
jgi:hypothetical protein